MANLEDYLKGRPLNEEMARLMRGEEPEDAAEQSAPPRESYADGTPITKQDRGHLARLQVSAGWAVLLKLLDTALQHQEDSARKISLEDPLANKDLIAAIWATLAADKKARNRIVAMMDGEVKKIKPVTKKKCASGTAKTPTEIN